MYDVALHRLPVIFCLDRAGITGPDGPSHHGVYDMAMLSQGARDAGARAVERPGARPDARATRWRSPTTARSPSAIRVVAPASSTSTRSATGSRRGEREPPADPAGAVCLLAVGKLVASAEKAAADLEAAGIDVTVWDVRCCAPLDPEMIADAAAHRVVVTAEDGVRAGGVGMTIADEIGAVAPAVPVHVLGIPTRFIPHAATPEEILAGLGLDATGIASAARALLQTA